MKLDTTVIEDDAAFAAQLAALEHGEKKKSKRTMMAADSDLDAQAAVDDPAVAAAAQALLEADGILPPSKLEDTAADETVDVTEEA